MLFKTEITKLFLSTVLLTLSLSAVSDIVPAVGVEDAKKQAEDKCKEGCLILTPAETAAIEQGIQEAVERAYKAGLNGWSSIS